MATPIKTLWTILTANLPQDKWLNIVEIYEIVEKNFKDFTPDDLKPVTKTNNEPTWHRNVRNALQTRRRSGEILYDGNARYKLPQNKNDDRSSSAYLFVRNPAKWNWTTMEQSIEQLENSGQVTERWSCRSYKTIKPGDRAFLARVGSEPRGIFAAGYVASQPFLSKHWSGVDKEVFRVLIDFEVLLNPDKEPILTIDILKTGNLERQQWTPQSSGISIRPDLVDELEAVWFNFLTTQKISYNPYAFQNNEMQKAYTEGTANQVTQTRYERNPFARAACIKYHGYSCSICEFDSEKHYGELGNKFIHVHHLTQVASVRKNHSVDPIKDLRPVCPNCHAMLHKQNPPLTIEELKMRLK
jgi:5-methylcytosine-specific restriction protein A